MHNHPTGTVAFLFTDMEGSPKLEQGHPVKWKALQRPHHSILQSAPDPHQSARRNASHVSKLCCTTLYATLRSGRRR